MVAGVLHRALKKSRSPLCSKAEEATDVQRGSRGWRMNGRPRPHQLRAWFVQAAAGVSKGTFMPFP